MATIYRIDKDLTEATKMANALEEYIRGDEVYGNVGGMFGSGDTPALTVGALAMRLRRLHVLRDRLNSSQQQELDAASQKHALVQKEWAMRYETHVLKEAKSRLDAMSTFFSECKESPRTCRANYLPEVLRRTMVQELTHIMQEQRISLADIQGRLIDVDARLRGIVTADKFQWDAQLESAYPAGEYWWLYQAPPVRDGNGQEE